jgi:hypothetical protein
VSKIEQTWIPAIWHRVQLVVSPNASSFPAHSGVFLMRDERLPTVARGYNFAMVPEKPENLIHIWGALSRSTPRMQGQWKHVDAMLNAARRDAKEAKAELSVLLAKSKKRNGGITDPLNIDLGLHRWLMHAREEAYSDWLGWVLEHLSGSDVLRVLAIRDQQIRSSCSDLKPHLVRESVIGEAGRLDLLIKFGDAQPPLALLVVEVKLGSAESAATAKQVGYSDWLETRKAKHKAKVLLVEDAQDAESHGKFVILLWSDVCIELRRLLPKLGKKLDPPILAMIIAFISAVERNLLRFSLDDHREGSSASILGTVRHLQNFLNKAASSPGCN